MPGGVTGGELDRLTCDHRPEPEPLDVESEVLHQPEAGPTGGQDGTPEGVIGEPLQAADDVASLLPEPGDEDLLLLVVPRPLVALHHVSSLLVRRIVRSARVMRTA